DGGRYWIVDRFCAHFAHLPAKFPARIVDLGRTGYFVLVQIKPNRAEWLRYPWPGFAFDVGHSEAIDENMGSKQFLRRLEAILPGERNVFVRIILLFYLDVAERWDRASIG